MLTLGRYKPRITTPVTSLLRELHDIMHVRTICSVHTNTLCKSNLKLSNVEEESCTHHELIALKLKLSFKVLHFSRH